jgi:alkylation response protein AidB-like acyl-CoA dehydrogenase
MTEIAKDASAAVIMSVNNCAGLEKYCNEEQNEIFSATLEVIGAFCLSEPEAGSDATSQKNNSD